MLTHTATVRGRAITWDHREVVQHGLNADRVELVTDREWQECDRVVAVLAKAGKEPVRVDAGDGFNIPSALMEDAGPLRMCLLGYKGDSVRIVTAKEDAPLCVVESGETGGMDPAPEQPDLWAQLMEDVRRATDGAKTAAQSATRAEADLRAAAERGDFDGEDGKTPVRGVDYWTAEDRKPIEDATLAATTAAGRADASAATATEGEASRVAAEAERANAEAARAEAEQAREIAETGRVEAEATRAANETMRTESFNTNLVSWNGKVDAACKKATDTASKAAQDAKTATDAAIAKTEEATQAAVAKAQTATDNATTAANKAEAAVSKLPLPLGNTLKGEVESTMVSVHDAYPAPLVTTKVCGQSNQVITTGKNLINGMESFCKASELPSNLRSYCWGYSLGQNPLKLTKPLKPGTYTFSIYSDNMVNIYLSQSPYNGTNESFSVNKKITNDIRNGLMRYCGTFELKNESDIVGIYSEYSTCCCGMLNEGTKPLPYEPYTGGKPSPSPDYPQEIINLSKAELVITGKNLADVNTISNVNFTLRKEALPAGTYTFSCDKDRSSGYTFNITKSLNFGNIMDYIVSGKNSPCTFTIKEPTPIYINGWGLSSDKYPIKNIQLEAGSISTTFKPTLKPKHTPIDFKGNELCSLPNGVKDEVVIDADGNVSLIKRVSSCVIDKSWDWNKGETQNGSSRFVAYVHNQGANHCTNTDVKCRSKIGICSPTDTWLEKDGCAVQGFDESTNCVFVYIKSLANETVDTFKQWITDNPFSVMYPLAEPQVIPLGKVELPALPEATSNVWNNGNIPANVYINYLKDVNIAFADLESKLTQAVVATAANL